ncbi:MAG: dockerin type I repeat-containing protein, partial [Clostridia bacterium]|nr:dockerin type I repeat-containing protein [Clostridia bacterium]
YATRARLLEVAITMANMQTIETYEIDDGVLNMVIDEICAQNTEKYVVPEKLTTAQAAAPDKVGNLVAFTGMVTKVEYDANGVLGTIHVDDGSGEVLVFLDGYINCSDGCEKDAQGYHDLSWVKEGVYLNACGIASIGQNSYENSDQIGPRIRTRSRADITRYVPAYGDANCDGMVTSADAALVLRALVGLSSLTTEGAINADVASDFDGMPNAADAVAILRYVVGLIKAFEAAQAE